MMNRIIFCSIFLCLFSDLVSQNDQDAIRYSQTFFGGTSRSKAMAGSFGALGADGACMSINPAGIGLYKKGDINISLGMRVSTSRATHNGNNTTDTKVNLPFDGLTFVAAWDSEKNKDAHHAFGLSCNQLVNFAANTTIEGVSNNKSIMDAVLATAQGSTVRNLDPAFAGLAYETYLLDTINGKYYSFVNTKFDVIQSKKIEKTGRINEWCFNYAYCYQDKLYIGATLAIPSVNYSYSSAYSEFDSKDSIRITNYNYPVYNYVGLGGFSELRYEENFRTTGNGYNLKLGAIYRATDFFRIGGAVHSPTFYNLTDTYNYGMYSRFDGGGNYSSTYPPDNGGRFKYRVITPLKLTGSVAFLIQKIAAINIDYDYIDYRQASLQSTPQVFNFANTTIQNKYNNTSNIRVGGELNLNPYFVRLGYAMYGSPFGETFTGDFVRSFYTFGLGYRAEKFYVDLSFIRSQTKEAYFMYNPNFVDKSVLTNSGTTIAFTIGSKF